MERSIQRWSGQSEETVLEAVTRTLSFDLIEKALRKSGRQSRRRRRLPNHLTLLLVVLMGFFRRTSYANLMEKFLGTSWTQQWWANGRPPATTSLTQARDRLGVKAVRLVFERCAEAIIAKSEGLVFHGRRVFGIDGTTCKTADTKKNRRRFGLPGASRGRAAYPQMRVAILADVGTRVVRKVKHGSYKVSEVTLGRRLLPTLRKGALVLLDRHFFAFDFLWEIHEKRECDFVVRIRRGSHPRVIHSVGPGDEIVEMQLPRHYRRLRPDMPRTWRLRLISYRPAGGRETIRLLTTLTDHGTIRKEEIASLYRDRWELETALDELKTHQCECTTVNRAVVFRSQTPQRVEQELYGLLIAYNAVRNVMAEAAETHGLSPLRLSFTSTLDRIRECLRDMVIHWMTPQERIRLMFDAVRRGVIPKRPHRRFPRAVKIKMSKYPLKLNALRA